MNNKEIIQLFENRYTCKGYDSDKKVSDEDFHTIIEAGRLSPSSMGFEPWEFVLLRNREVLEEIRPYSWGAEHAIDGASHFLLILARVPNDMKPDSEYLRYIQEDIQNYPRENLPGRIERYTSFREEDFDLTDDRKVQDWTRMQTYIPFTNMLTVAAMLGVDSTPIEGFNRKKLDEIFVKHGVYDPNHFVISNILAFGYKNRDHREKTRRPIEEVYKVFE